MVRTLVRTLVDCPLTKAWDVAKLYPMKTTNRTRLYSVYTVGGSLIGQVRALSRGDAIDYALYLWPMLAGEIDHAEGA